jgi:predicted glycogen debranching enzyme
VTDRLLALPPLLEVPADALSHPDTGSSYEWIESDGEGGWAAGTANGAATRRQHGLLVIARPGIGRIVLLSRCEEAVVTADGQRVDLASNFYPGAVHPEGYRALAGFSLDPWPVWRFRVGSFDLVREIFRSHRSRALIMRYRYDGPPATLEVRPLFAGRPVNALVTANEFVRRDAEASEGIVAYQPYDDTPAAVLTFVEGEWEAAPTWFYRNAYPRDVQEMGGESREDLFAPGVLRVALRAGTPTTIVCGLRSARIGRIDRRLNEEIARRGAIALRGRRLAASTPALSDMAARLALAADLFAPRGFADPPVAFPTASASTRELLVSLPWITLAAGGETAAIALLRSLGAHRRGGLLPLRFDDPGDDPGSHAAADLPLWYIEAAASLADRGHDVGALLPTVIAILDAWIAGADHGIQLGEDGLVAIGPADRPLTWMDAVAHGQPVTPRSGRAVEINALWYNALLRGAGLVEDRLRAERWRSHARRCAEAFQKFWWDDAHFLVDTLDAAGHADHNNTPQTCASKGLVRTLSPVRVSHSFTVWSDDAEATRCPSGLNVTL